ncbi:RidA family protein [Falsiphaeobacter marinintestinus]|uniref:RidA family protein n=1 Tax=Falsiphaeobacter marinintestinus TaxID=1492905 RepID=UPI0011B5B1E1|nr:RidA family protein [Phaeobacter marinintestinus]
MGGTPIIPKALQGNGAQLNLSPGIISGDHVFLTGMTGSLADGSVPEDPATQFRRAFAKIGAVLDEAGLDLGAVVEMTSYHVGLHDHFDVFDAVRLEVLSHPYPAWTAVEVAGLRRPGALVEIRAIARLA